MNLPKKDKDGVPFLSYSQVDLWHCAKGFDTGLPGKQEYIRKYFLGEKFPSGVFAQFGKEVEDYICERKSAEMFDEKEKAKLETIKPLGVFQKQFRLDFDGFYAMGFIDDANEDFSVIADYKTASPTTVKKYSKPEYEQLDLYALAIRQLTGRLPERMYVCAISRTGNGFKFGRDVLKVGEDIWYIERTTNEERLAALENKIITTAQEISEYYTVFQKLNKIK
jgi:hypothetical protein